ncbi:dienelactone hydrolase family protein [Marinomonas pollencensis]|uniref:Dienelactone hydrolase n=1 Tax=Marinomonas pollencensis TaxID=491954 RepID=A0A3E0DIF6_9GAMM|nr:dienelactone hydrolase family protein [Marinomonas pollencensis]REG81823.1 dienelactone hydrolase [Marinomonas pollencensis]
MSDTFHSLFIDNVNRQHYHLMPSGEASQPVHVVIWPTYSGLTDFEKSIADKVASLGYSVTAVDLYGPDCVLESADEKLSLMGKLVENSAPLHSLQRTLIDASMADIHDKSIVHIGFCLGGRLALEAGLHFSDSVGAASFHGLMSFNRATKEQVNPDLKIMVFNGHNDPLVSPESCQSAKQYWTELALDFQFIDFGNTVHSFMMPSANNPDHGSMYNPQVAKRSYVYLENFLAEF